VRLDEVHLNVLDAKTLNMHRPAGCRLSLRCITADLIPTSILSSILNAICISKTCRDAITCSFSLSLFILVSSNPAVSPPLSRKWSTRPRLGSRESVFLPAAQIDGLQGKRRRAKTRNERELAIERRSRNARGVIEHYHRKDFNRSIDR
jgi:hypothetical protein